MSFISLNNSVPLSAFSYVSAISEYFRWSQYGQLVVVDVGGLTLTGTGTILPNADSPLPVMRTRPVAKLICDTTMSYGATIYGTIGLKGLNITSGATTGQRLFGTIVYFTDYPENE